MWLILPLHVFLFIFSFLSFLAFIALPFYYFALSLLAYATLIILCFAVVRPRWIGLLSGLISIGCVVVVAFYAQYKCSIGEEEIKTMKNAIEFGTAVFLCLTVWIIPIAAVSGRWLSVLSGGITCMLSLICFGCYWFFIFGPMIEEANLNTMSNIDFAKFIGCAIMGGIILPITTLVSPFLVGQRVQKLVNKG